MHKIAPLLAAPALAAAAVLLCAQDVPAQRGAGKVLLLRSERVLEGDVERVGGQYRVRCGDGESWVAAGQAVRLFADWDELCRFMRSRANLSDPDERLRLAHWCQRHGLKRQALDEARAALELRPGHVPTQRLAALLERGQAGATAPRREPAAAPAAAPRVDLTADALNAFTTRVQPILMNACARCHTAGGGAFRLARVTEGLERHAAQENVAAALAQVDAGDAALSPLLIKALSSHGGPAQPPLKGPTAPAYVILRGWVEKTVATNPHLRAKKAAPAPAVAAAPAAEAAKDTPPPVPPAAGTRPQVVSRALPRPEVTPAAVHATPAPAPLPAAVRQAPAASDPDDPYDPGWYHDRYHRRQE